MRRQVVERVDDDMVLAIDDRLGRAHARPPRIITYTSSSSISTAYVTSFLLVILPKLSPVASSNSQRCHGQATTSVSVRYSYSNGAEATIVPPTVPAQMSAPWCGQRLRTAKNPWSVLTTPIGRPPM